jgi:hypothetical protein
MCVEQVTEVLEITGNPHSLEGLGRNRQDGKPGTCLTRPVQAPLNRGTNVEVLGNLAARSQSQRHYCKTYHRPPCLWPPDSITVLSKQSLN